MADLAALLDQDVAAERLFADLDQPGARVVRLTGPAGSGKSHLARMVATRWRDVGRGCVVAIGDENHSARDLYPLLSGLSQSHADWVGIASTGTRSAIGLAETTLGVPKVTSSIFDLLTAGFRQKTERSLKAFSSTERDVILDLKRLARSCDVLLVADNAHWWDADSLRLLQHVVSDQLRETIPQLTSVAVLLVDTADEQTVVATAPFESLTEMCTGQTHRTVGCGRDRFPEVLQAFGLSEPLPDPVARALFSATDGHLKLAEQVAVYAKHHGVTELIAAGEDGFLSTIVSARFASLGRFSPEVSELLARAAVLGLSFTQRDLSCIASRETAEVEECVIRAESIGFLERQSERIVFSHDVLRSAILSIQARPQLGAFYAKLAECLAILRPGDYTARAQALLQAGDTDEARDMLALASVAALRHGTPPSRVLNRIALQFPDDDKLAAYLRMIADAYTAVGTGDFAASLPALHTSPEGESRLMAAERNYLAALCCMELQTAAGMSDARTILNAWIPRLVGEVELALRFKLLLQQAQVLSSMLDEARATEADIQQQLLDRRFDPDAAVTLQIQNRRAGAVNALQIAERRAVDAVRFFTRGTQETIRDQLELYRSLNNLAAIQTRLGKDAEAYGHALEAERIALEFPDVVKRIDVLASNVVLSGHRSGAIGVSDAIERQRLIIDSPDGSDDKFIHRCNLAAYLLLAARDEEAADELSRLGDEMTSHEFDESYLVFFWTALWAASAALAGDAEEATRRHAGMDAFVEGLTWPCAGHVRRRQRLLAEVLPSFRPSDSRGTDDMVLVRARPSEVGAGWSYYARLIPCCELSFWSDS